MVYHLAAAVGVDWVLRHPLRSLETNIQGTEHVLRACAAIEGGRRVLIASTRRCTARTTRTRWPKMTTACSARRACRAGSTRRPRPSTRRSRSRTGSERRLPVTVVRLFNTVGPRQTGRYGMVVPRFVRWALRGEPLRVYGDGQQTRCFTNVHDVVHALVALTETPARGRRDLQHRPARARSASSTWRSGSSSWPRARRSSS